MSFTQGCVCFVVMVVLFIATGLIAIFRDDDCSLSWVICLLIASYCFTQILIDRGLI